MTAYGESCASIINTYYLKLGETEPGSAGSGISGHCHLALLLETVTKISPGFQLINVTNLIHFLQYIIGYINDISILCNLPNSTPTHKLLQIATTVLQSWKHLLQHAGGDLSFSKFLFTLITYVPTKHGELRMAIVDEIPGNLVIQNTPTMSERICRVEPSHAERILGVHMTATAQIKNRIGIST